MEITLEGAKDAKGEAEAAERREFSAGQPPPPAEVAPPASSTPLAAPDAPPPVSPSDAPELPANSLPDAPPPDAQPFPPPEMPPTPPAPQPPPVQPPQAREERRQSARVDSPAKPRKPIKPDYPKAARQRGEQGRVVLRIRIDGKGLVESAAVATSSGFDELDAAALRAVRSVRFVPAKSGGASVASEATLSLEFKLDR